MRTLKIALSLMLVVSGSALAAECVDGSGKDITNQPEVFQELIAKASSCFEAKELAEACAWGSSLDVFTAGTAYDVCERELQAQAPSGSLTRLLKKMKGACSAKYAEEEGTLYRSLNAYCHLSAVEWILNLATPN